TVPGTPTKIGGLLVWNNRLYGTLNAFYDGSDAQVATHFSRPLNLSTNGDVRGPYRVYSPTVTEPGLKAHLYAGWLAVIPQAWRALFLGSALTGNCCVNLVSSESFGPAAFSWDPDNLTNNQTVTTQFYYPQSNQLMPWASTNPVW